MAQLSSVHLPYIGDGQFIPSASVIVPKDGVNYERQVVVIGDPDNPDGFLVVSDGKLGVTATDLDIRNLSGTTDSITVSNTVGTPFYRSGTTALSLVLSGGRRVFGITASAIGTDGTITINGGDTVTIRAGSTFSYEPNGNLVNPTIVFSANLDWFVEGVI
jgi:hypothetical protein